MKRNIILLLLCCFCSIASAQKFYAGASLGIQCLSLSIDGESQTATSYGFSPEFGYQFNQWVALGSSIGISYTEPGGEDSDYTTVAVSPYLRGIFTHHRTVQFFTDAIFTYQHAKYHSLEYGADIYGFSINPGLLVSLNDHLKFKGRTELFGFANSKSDDIEVKTTGFSIGNSLSLGIIYQF